MENIEEKLKVLQSMGVLGIRKLIPVGGSYAVIIPKEWIDYYTLQTNSGYWVKLLPTEEGNILLASVTEDEVKSLYVAEP